MSGNERREAIWRLLQQSSTVINASTLATRFGVTRQIIVSDIALLRANGRPIAAERRGYLKPYYVIIPPHKHWMNFMPSLNTAEKF